MCQKMQDYLIKGPEMALYDWKYYIESRTNMIQVRLGNIKLQDKQHIYDFIKANSNDKYDLSSPK